MNTNKKPFPSFLSYYFALAFFFFFSGWTTLTATCTYARQIEAKELNIGNMISWSTSSEENNAHFLVQKSLDGRVFKTIGQTQAAGTTTEEQHYRYLDIATGENRVFYRLRQIDFDGDFTQTNTILVNRANENNMIVTVMSNTLTDRFFSVGLSSKVKGDAKFDIQTLDGKVHKTGALRIVEGSNVISIDLQGLENQVYKMIITNKEEREELIIEKVDEADVPKINYVIKE